MVEEETQRVVDMLDAQAHHFNEKYKGLAEAEVKGHYPELGGHPVKGRYLSVYLPNTNSLVVLISVDNDRVYIGGDVSPRATFCVKDFGEQELRYGLDVVAVKLQTYIQMEIEKTPKPMQMPNLWPELNTPEAKR